jgi:hypothetical protein
LDHRTDVHCTAGQASSGTPASISTSSKDASRSRRSKKRGSALGRRRFELADEIPAPCTAGQASSGTRTTGAQANA